MVNLTGATVVVVSLDQDSVQQAVLEQFGADVKSRCSHVELDVEAFCFPRNVVSTVQCELEKGK